ncbi:MAG: hypothetical protein KAT16_09740, partial [Candidatus Heimdallarchaeota archaeon]|nr:hypothetical protein [Candidatus Heimdallarchaeota archaeon]
KKTKKYPDPCICKCPYGKEKVPGKDLIPKYNFHSNTFKIIADCWLCGPPGKDLNGKKFDGAFPGGFLQHIKECFREYYPVDRRFILHVCSGRTPPGEGMRLDIDPKYSPDYLCNAEDFILKDGSKVPTEKFDFVISDTPYNEDAAKKYYSKKMLKRSKVLQQMARVCTIGGFIGVLDQTLPVIPPKCLQVVARIGVTSVPNLDMRIFTVMKKLYKYEGKEKDDGLARIDKF